MMPRTSQVVVIGGGPWGQALAHAAVSAGSHVTLLTRRSLPASENLAISAAKEVVATTKLLVLAVPSTQVAHVARELAPYLNGSHLLVHGVRGLVGEHLHTISEIIRSETAVHRLGALGGPVLTAELEAGAPSLLVVGSHFAEVIASFREAFGSNTLRIYATQDLKGLEWASALTSCMAIAIGYALGAGLGPGLIAGFTTRAVHEIARLTVAAGGEHATLFGLAGLADLLAAVGQDGRPEVTFGRALATGASWKEAQNAAAQRMEALELLPLVIRWAEQAAHVRAPILTTMVQGLCEKPPLAREDLIRALMSAPIVEGDT